MGPNMLKQESCNHPGLGDFYNPAIDAAPPVEPAPLRERPPEPDFGEEPVPPQDQSDSIAMAEFATKLEDFRSNAKIVEDNFRKDMAEWEAELKVYQAEQVAYETARVNQQIALQSAVAPAEGIVKTFYDGISWSYVDKEDRPAYFAKITKTWLVQLFICLILFVAILYLQKRKDVT